MWNIFRNRSADIARARQNEKFVKRTEDLRKLRAVQKEKNLNAAEELAKNPPLIKDFDKDKAEEERKKLPEDYVLPEKLSPFTDNQDLKPGDVPPLETKNSSYRVPNPTHPQGYDLYTANVFPEKPDRFRDLTLKSAFQDKQAPFRFLGRIVDALSYMRRSIIISAAYARRKIIMRRLARRNDHQFFGNMFWKRNLDRKLWEYPAKLRKEQAETERAGQEEEWQKKLEILLQERGLMPTQKEIDDSMRRYKEQKKCMEEREIPPRFLNGKPMDERRVKNTFLPSRMVLTENLEPDVINDYPKMTLQEAKELLAWEPEHTIIDAMINYNVQYDMNDPLKGGSEYLQSKLYEAHMLLVDVYKQYGTIAQDDITSKSIVTEDIATTIKEIEDRKTTRPTLEDDIISYNNDAERWITPDIEPGTVFEDAVSPANYSILEEELRKIKDTDPNDVQAKINAWEGFWIREHNIVNQFRRDNGEKEPLSFTEYFRRLQFGETMSDVTDSTKDYKKHLLNTINWYYNAVSQVPLTVVDHYEHAKMFESMKVMFPADWDSGVRVMISYIDEIINHYLDVLADVNMSKQEINDVNAIVQELGPLATKIIESVKIYREDFEENPKLATVKHVGRIFITKENNNNFLFRVIDVDEEEMGLYHAHMTGTPFWDIQGLEGDELTPEESELFDWSQATTLPDTGFEPPEYYDEFEEQSKTIADYLQRRKTGMPRTVAVDENGVEIPTPKVKPVHILRYDLYGIYGITDEWTDPILKLERNMDLTEFEIRMVRKIAVQHETNSGQIIEKLNAYIEQRSLEGKITRKLYNIEMSRLDEEELYDDDEDEVEQ